MVDLPHPVVFAIQKGVDAVLAMDPELKSSLTGLEGQVICLHLKGLEVRVYLIVVDGEVDVVRVFEGDVDTTLSGTPFAVASLMSDSQALFSGDVEIQGNLETGKKIKKLVNSITIDWEEQLSHVVGDGVAHQLGRAHKNLLQWVTRRETNFNISMGDYLKDEADLVVSESELTGFCHGVDDLRGAVDRLEARLQHLTEKGTDIVN